MCRQRRRLVQFSSLCWRNSDVLCGRLLVTSHISVARILQGEDGEDGSLKHKFHVVDGIRNTLCVEMVDLCTPLALRQ